LCGICGCCDGNRIKITLICPSLNHGSELYNSVVGILWCVYWILKRTFLAIGRILKKMLNFSYLGLQIISSYVKSTYSQ